MFRLQCVSKNRLDVLAQFQGPRGASPRRGGNAQHVPSFPAQSGAHDRTPPLPPQGAPFVCRREFGEVPRTHPLHGRQLQRELRVHRHHVVVQKEVYVSEEDHRVLRGGVRDGCLCVLQGCRVSWFVAPLAREEGAQGGQSAVVVGHVAVADVGREEEEQQGVRDASVVSGAFVVFWR